MIEIWKEIKDYEDLYKINNFGKIISLRNNRERKSHLDKYGYYRSILSKDKKQRNVIISRMVAEAFIPNPNNLPQVNHIDGNKQNNHVSNLEWISNIDNQIHARKTGLINNNGVNSGNSKFTEEDVIKIRNLKGILSCKKIGDLFGVSSTTIHYIFKNKTYKNT
jgi:hypothetical protein